MSILHHASVVGVGTSQRRTLAIRLQERHRSLAKVGVIKAPQVKLGNGLFRTKEKPTSVPTTPEI